MKRNGAAYMQSSKRSGRRTSLRNGKFVGGPKRNKKGVGRGGRVR